jgi:hypothetical protein
MIQFEPMYDTIGEREYKEKILPPGNIWYAVKSAFGKPSEKFQGYVNERHLNRLNGRVMYRLWFEPQRDPHGIHSATWFYQDDLLEIANHE